MSHILTTLHGNRCGLDNENRLIAPAGYRIGNHGAQVDVASAQTVSFLDDFLGAVIDTNKWLVPKGSDAATVAFAATTGASGRIVATTGAGAGGTMAVNGVQLVSGLQYEANAGGLYMETKLQISAITNISMFVGFGNAVTLQAPAIGSGVADGVTTNAVDCVGFLFDTAMTTKNLWLIGSANNVDATFQNSKIAPVAATDITLRVQVDKSGAATFFINGAPIGSLMSGAVTKTALLTPNVSVFTRTAASQTCNVDYVAVGCNRN